MAEVKLVNICKSFDNKINAVESVNLEITDKEFVVLVGPSGCGKSTTLRMIAGLEEITSGEIYLDGEKVNDVPPKNRDIAMVFQNYALYPHMTVFENMAFGLKLRKMKKADIKKRVDEAASVLGLENLLERKPKQLSGGQRQRVAVGRAIVRKPKVFLFDEPLSNLDAKLRVQMRTEISKLHKKLDATMIYVTHDQTEAMTMGDRIVIMKDGIVNQVDSPLNLYNNPANKFVAGFIGSPSMNFIDGKFINDNGLKFISEKGSVKISVLDNQQQIPENYFNKNVALGVRSENISLGEDNITDKIKIEIEVVEPMGNEVFAYFNIDDVQFVGRFNSSFESKPGSQIHVSFEKSKLLFFDCESGDRIY